MMANRYLTHNGLERALTQGHTVEQWLGVRTEGNFKVLKWLSIERHRDESVVLRVREVLDDGNPDFLDVYEFTPYDSEAEFGVESTFATPQEALQYALDHVGANRDRFVAQGVIQDEYADYLKTRS